MSAFKYRSLADLKRFLDIIVNKRLYGATYLSLNDPMEGQFDFDLSEKFPHPALQQLFDDRAKTRICSLSKKVIQRIFLIMVSYGQCMLMNTEDVALK